MMLEGSVPIDHKEYDERKGKVHRKEDNSASTVFDKLVAHPFSGSVPRCMPSQKEAHYAKANIICAKRIEPKGVVVKAEPQLEKSVQGIPRKRTKE